jgi:uncharacterized protein (TIGR00369 family)
MSDLLLHPLLLKYNELNHFGQLIGMNYKIHEPGNLSYFLDVTEPLLATPTALHGGVIAAFCDAILGVGALSLVCQQNKVVSTVEMKVSFISPALLGDRLTGTSRVIKAGNRLIFMEAQIYNQDNVLIATSSGTFNAYPAEKAGY